MIQCCWNWTWRGVGVWGDNSAVCSVFVQAFCSINTAQPKLCKWEMMTRLDSLKKKSASISALVCGQNLNGCLLQDRSALFTWCFQWIVLPAVSEHDMQNRIFNQRLIAQVVPQALLHVHLMVPGRKTKKTTTNNSQTLFSASEVSSVSQQPRYAFRMATNHQAK